MAVGGAMYQWEEACSSRTGHTAVGGVIHQWGESRISGRSHVICHAFDFICMLLLLLR